MRSKAFKNITLYLFCLFAATLFIVVFSRSTTPLIKNNWGFDSAFFILVGQGMTKGLLPYRDFFDMKGPYLFLIEFIGQKICYGRTGAFIVQCFNISFCLYIIGKMSDLFTTRLIWLHRIIAFLPVLAVAAVNFEGGNLTEEYCLPAVLLSLYFCIKYFKGVEAGKGFKHPLLYSLFYGFAVGFICFVRITNAATVGAILVVIFLFLLHKKEFKNAVLNLLMVFSGFVATCAGPCIFFYSKNLLPEMLNQIFVFGATYSAEFTFMQKFQRSFSHYGLYFLILLLPVVICIIYREKWYMMLLSLLSALLLLVAVTMGNAFAHYLMLFIPHVVLAVIIAIKKGSGAFKTGKNIICVICFALFFSIHFVRVARKASSVQNTYSNSGGGSCSYAQDIALHIPENERSSVYCFGDEYWSKWYTSTGTMPANRYMDWQTHYIKLMPEIEGEIASWIENDGCLWIVVPAEGESISDKVNAVIDSHYDIEYANEEYILYNRV